MRQICISLVMYADTYNQYPNSYYPTKNVYCWQPELLSLMGNNRGAFFCPAALPESAWDPNVNKTIVTRSDPWGVGALGLDPYAITAGTPNSDARFSLGYNDWGSVNNPPVVNGVKPCYGLGGDLGDTPPVTPIKDTMVVKPSNMIAIGDVRSDIPTGSLSFNANLDPTDPTTLHCQWPSNRHNYRTDILFADGHVEKPLRNSLMQITNDVSVAQWNNDNQPHHGTPDIATPSNVLEQ